MSSGTNSIGLIINSSNPLATSIGGTGNTSGTLPPSGSAGGDLGGTYPNPTVSKINTVPVSSSTVSDGQLLIGSTSGSNYSAATLTGTANQVNVTNASHSVTFSLPQSIATSSSPQFTGLKLSGLSTNSIVITDTSSNIITDSALTYANLSGSPILSISTPTASASVAFALSSTGSAGTSFMTMNRGDINGKSFINFESNTGIDQWWIGLGSTGTSSFQILDQHVGTIPFSITVSTGIVNIPSLTASQAVITDGSKNLTSLAYTSANTASTLIQRDSSGNFSAGTITASLSGNASTSTTSTTATNANNVATTQVSNNATYYPLLVASSTNSNQAPDLSTALTYNPSTNTLTIPNLNVNTASSIDRVTIGGAGSNTNTPLVYIGSFSAGTAGNFYSMIIDKSGTESLLMGINKNSTTGQVPSNATFISTYTSSGQLSLGRGGGNSQPSNADILIGTAGDVTIGNGSVDISTAGKTLKIAQGSNACAGTGATMSSGAVTVNTTAVATGDIILVTKTASGGTLGTGMPVVTISNGASFTLTSSNVLETSTFSWVIIKAG